MEPIQSFMFYISVFLGIISFGMLAKLAPVRSDPFDNVVYRVAWTVALVAYLVAVVILLTYKVTP